MELIIILLIAVEVVIVLIREGPELSHKLFYPIITYVQELLHPGGEPKTASDLIHDELPRLQEALERVPHTSLLAGLSMSREGSEDEGGSRLV
jgi:hypothetical protein